ncbi:MAG: hypothetical protein WEF86_06050 [Gemmatimonadota bacterium]
MRVTRWVRAAVLALCTVTAAPAAAQQFEQSLIQDLAWRNIGNANQKGRISSIDALDDDWTHVVVGTASGGVFKSTNGGTTFESIFDDYGTASIGDVAIFPGNPDIIWVGTGEECGRNVAAWGDGVYKSIDGGRTFRNMGLKGSYTIGTVLPHPTNEDLVYVAALGNIWGEGGERGLYRTTDGGESWTRLSNGLPAEDGRTGAIYVVMDPTDPSTLYVTFWERKRTAWILDSGGPNGGVFKSTDGGDSWTKLTNGLPEGPSGKIGIDIARSNPEVLMLHYEHGYQPVRGTPEYDDMTKLGSGIYRSEDGGASWQYMNRYWSRPFYYNHVAISPHDDEVTFHYNQNFQVSRDGGRTLEPMPRGGEMHCWHAIWLDPHNRNRFWVGSDGGVALTHDEGDTYVAMKNINATQYYYVGADMRDPYWVYGGLQDAGTSGGPSMTRADGIHLTDWVNVQGGDGYYAAPDWSDWRYVYTGQDPKATGAAVSRTDMLTRERKVIRPMKGLNILNYDDVITPAMEAANIAKGWGEPVVGRQDESRSAGSGAFRWNWASPVVISPNDPQTIYTAANHLFKSTDRGETWRIISPDLSKNDPVKTRKESGGLTPDHVPGGGAEYYGTISQVAESPLNRDIVWVGTDDGNVQLTRDGGASWTNVGRTMRGLPHDTLYVTHVVPSSFDPASAFISIDGHESGIFQPFIFRTDDYGATWTGIARNLPQDHPIFSIEQDNENPDLLFAGSEFAIFYSIDGGGSWTRFNRNLPTVEVHDILVHRRDPDLIIGTHGRGIWIMDDISALKQMTPAIRASDAHLFRNEVATLWLDRQPMGEAAYAFLGENPTKNAVINYWLGTGVSGPVTIDISDGVHTRRCSVEARGGIGRLEWDLRWSPAPGEQSGQGGGGNDDDDGPPNPCGEAGSAAVEPGTYVVTLAANGEQRRGSITVRQDPLLDTAAIIE